MAGTDERKPATVLFADLAGSQIVRSIEPCGALDLAERVMEHAHGHGRGARVSAHLLAVEAAFG